MARLRVEMRDHDIDGLHLTLEPLQDIPLRIRFEGSPARRDAFVFLQSQNGHLVQAVTGKRGLPVMQQVPPGSYRVAVESASLSGDGYVKSAILGTKDILTKSVRIALGKSPGSLTVVIAEDGAKVMGTVTGRNGKPDKKAFVVLVPAPSLRKVLCFYKSASTYPSGRFEIRGIRPGSYTLFAWDHAPYLSWFDPLFLKDMRGRGIPLKLKTGEIKTLRLQSIRVSPSEGGQL